MINLEHKLLDWILIGKIISIVIAEHINTITVTVGENIRKSYSVLSIISIISSNQ